MTLRSCTISGNQSGSCGGVAIAAGSASVGDTIVAGNTGSSANPDCYGAFSSVGYKLIGSGIGSTGFNNFGDQVGTSGSPIDPLLGPLQNNGGPTQTMALLPGSPAIDQGVTEAGVTTDQRGQPRIYDYPNIPNAIAFGDGSDIGAFELSPPPVLSITAYAGGGGVIVSWPTYAVIYGLEYTTNLNSAISWTPASGTPLVSGNQYQYYVNFGAPGEQFFRLVSPGP